MADRMLSDVIDDLDDLTSLRFLAQQARALGVDPHAVVTIGTIAVKHLGKYGRLCSIDALEMLAGTGRCVCPVSGEHHPVQCRQHPSSERRRQELSRVLADAVRCGLVEGDVVDRWLAETDDDASADPS